jgi:hypothetical protein
MDVTEMVILDEHAAAVAVASEALDLPMQEFHVRICSTARVEYNCNIEAVDMDHAKQLALLLNPHPKEYELMVGYDIEGDEIAYITPEDDETYSIEEVVDLKEEGEPFSWEACELVKELAKVETWTSDTLQEFVHKARELCKGGRKKPVHPV